MTPSDRTERRFRATAWAVTLLLAAVIGLLTLTPAIATAVAGGDKLHHFAAFAVLVLPLATAYPRHVLPVMLAAAGYGLLIEIVQPHFGRSAEAADFVADLLGAGAGAVLGRWAGLGLRRRLARG